VYADYEELIDYYELTVPEGDYTEEELEDFGDVEEEEAFNVERANPQNCYKLCRGDKNGFVKPRNCKALAKSKIFYFFKIFYLRKTIKNLVIHQKKHHNIIAKLANLVNSTLS